MTANELRQKYLDFFKSKGHTIIPSESLIPENDPTVLFTTAGMHPLVPYLMGENHPGGKRVANAQKCVRTGDIDEVGDTTHHTFFEMLGNWSFGDYFKKEAIEWSWEFLTSEKWLGLDKNRIAVSVFAGDEDAPFDEEAFQIWKNLGMPEARIAKLPKKNNWWGPAGETGPCGPDTEMFYWVGDPDKVPASFNDDNNLWVEIWNDVFMQFNKNKEGKYELLKQQNVDTGMGLVRVLSAINNLGDNYKTELFAGIIKKIEELSGKKYGSTTFVPSSGRGALTMDEKIDETTRAMRIIADHLKATTFIMGDDRGVAPSNTDQGYVVRRLIRRAIRYGLQIGIKKESWTKDIARVIIDTYKEIYPELERNIDFVINHVGEEEEKFNKTLERGLKKFNEYSKKGSGHVLEEYDNGKLFTVYLDGEVVFDLYQTYGFPFEMTKELAKEKCLEIDEVDFKRRLAKHQDLSRTASAGMFKGGLADASEESKRYHTAAHLLLAALRKVLGEHVIQKGSNITAERLRFDFSHPEKMTDEQKKEVEVIVNEAIKKDLPVSQKEISLDEAKAQGAMGVFESKYGEMVKVYTIGEEDGIVSKEICGGPHVERTGELGNFSIKKEESSSSGVRRIKAILS